MKNRDAGRPAEELLADHAHYDQALQAVADLGRRHLDEIARHLTRIALCDYCNSESRLVSLQPIPKHDRREPLPDEVRVTLIRLKSAREALNEVKRAQTDASPTRITGQPTEINPDKA